MPRTYELHPDLDKKLSKLAKKDKDLFEATLKKIDEIITCKDLTHYKNLKKPLQHYQRVHLKSSFVLLFKTQKEHVLFTDLEHHDNIYL